MSERNRAWRRKQEIAHRRKREESRKYKKQQSRRKPEYWDNDIEDIHEISTEQHISG